MVAAKIHVEHPNLADDDAVVRSGAGCEAAFGPLSGVVNSAGIGKDLPALDGGAAFSRRILDLDLIGRSDVSREVARRRRDGDAVLDIAWPSRIGCGDPAVAS